MKNLHSLKFIQRFEPEENVDPITAHLRSRPYEEFLKDPIGTKYRDQLERLRNDNYMDHFTKRIDFVKLEKEVRAGFKEWQDYNEAEKQQSQAESRRRSYSRGQTRPMPSSRAI